MTATKIKPLNLSSCTTNAEVCKLVSKQLELIPYEDLLAEVEKNFVYQAETTKALYTGLYMNINVFLSGPGGYGKSTLIQFILNLYKIPFTIIVGYKDMPVEALLGIPNMSKLLKESKYEVNFKQSCFCNPGVLIIEEFTDVLPATAAALKTILTEKGFHGKDGKVESLISCLIIAANKSSQEIIDDESKKAFYKERFPLQAEVKWDAYTSKDYFKLLSLRYPEQDKPTLFFLSKVLEDNHTIFGNTISPRIALEITDVYLKLGLDHIAHFPIRLDNVTTLRNQADREYTSKTAVSLLKSIIEVIDTEKDPGNKMLVAYYSLWKLSSLVATEDIMLHICAYIKIIETKIINMSYGNNSMIQIDQILNSIENDPLSP